MKDQESAVSNEVTDFESTMDQKIKSDKKSQAKEQLKIIRQFETIADSFTSKPKQELLGTAQKETAGTIKRREREKTKKEKTLSAKLRLKAKKNK